MSIIPLSNTSPVTEWQVTDTTSFGWSWYRIYGSTDWTNDKITVTCRPGYWPGDVGYVDMELGFKDQLILAENGLWHLSLQNMEILRASSSTTQVEVDIVSDSGFITDGSVRSISMDVGHQTMTYVLASLDSTLYMGAGFDRVNFADLLNANLDYEVLSNPAVDHQYWAVIRRDRGQVDVYSLYTGNRVRMQDELGYSYGKVEKFWMADYRNGGDDVYTPYNDPVIIYPNDRGTYTNIDLKTYESGSWTYNSDSFNLAWFNHIRWTSNNLYVGEATVQQAGIYSTPGAITTKGSQGSHDLIVAEQATAIYGNLRLYVRSVSDRLYNQFNKVFLGSSSGEGVDWSAISGVTVADRMALYGFGGNDQLKAGAAADYIFGGQSSYNQLVAGAIGNQVYGGAGADFFGVGNTDSSGSVSGSTTSAGYGATIGYGTDVIYDWDAWTDTLRVLSNGVAVIGGLYGVSGMTGDNTINLRASSGAAAVADDEVTLTATTINQTTAVSNEGDELTVVNEGLIVARGQGGNDVLYDSPGNDYLYGNADTNVVNMQGGGADRVFFDSRSGKQYVSGFSSNSGDKFYLAKNAVDAFSGGASKSSAIYDATTGYTYAGGQKYQQGLDYLYGVTYKGYLANSYGAQPYHNWQHDVMGFAADVTTYVAGAVMIGVGIGLCYIPIVGPALGAPVIAAGVILEAGKIYTQVANWQGSNPHHNAVYDLTPDASFTSNYVYVLNNDVLVNTTAASGSSANENNVNFLSFFSSTNQNDGFAPALELNPYGFLGGDTFNKSIYAYFAVHSNEETFVYLISSRDNLIENSEATKVAEINGYLTASDFVVYDSNTDPYNQTADVAVALKDPTITGVNVGPADEVSVSNGGKTAASSLIVHGSIGSAASSAMTIALFDGNGNVSVGTATISSGSSAFSINDTRTLGQSIVQTDYNSGAATLRDLSLNNTFEYQDTKVIYYATLSNEIDGGIILETRSNVFSVTANGAGAASIDGGAGTDTLILQATSLHLNTVVDNKIVNIEAIRVNPSMGPGLSVAVTGGVVTGVSILDSGDNVADGTYSLTFKDESTGGAEGGATGWTVDIVGGHATTIHSGAGGHDYTENTYASANWGVVGVSIDLHNQSESFTVTGYSGNDTIIGAGGHDYISGADGNDSMTGGAGNDTFVGGAGSDTINADSGSDTIYFMGSDNSAGASTGYDTINNFTSGTDQIYYDAGVTVSGSYPDYSQSTNGFVNRDNNTDRLMYETSTTGANKALSSGTELLFVTNSSVSASGTLAADIASVIDSAYNLSNLNEGALLFAVKGSGASDYWFGKYVDVNADDANASSEITVLAHVNSTVDANSFWLSCVQAPQALGLSMPSDTGVDDLNNVTTDRVVTVTGRTGSLYYSTDSGSSWTAVNSDTFSLAADATYAAGAVQVRQKDDYDNYSATTYANLATVSGAAYTTDNTAPSLSLTNQASTLPGNVTFQWSLTESNPYSTKLYVDGSPYDVTGLPSKSLNLAAGSHSWSVDHQDAAGNTATNAGNGFTLVVPDTPATLSSSVPANNVQNVPSGTDISLTFYDPDGIRLLTYTQLDHQYIPSGQSTWQNWTTNDKSVNIDYNANYVTITDDSWGSAVSTHAAPDNRISYDITVTDNNNNTTRLVGVVSWDDPTSAV